MKKAYLLLLILLGCLQWNANAGRLEGKISDSKNEPLGFANIYVKALAKGTVSNIEGKYFLELPDGVYEIEFRYVGYKTHTENVTISGITKLDVTLEASGYTTKAITVTNTNPAIPIIKKAIAKRSFYNKQANDYRVQTYIKGYNRLTAVPKKIFGQEIELDKEDTGKNGYVYLSESVSDFVTYQGKVKEKMIASKVSGESRGFSINNYLSMRNSVYTNNVRIPSTKKGIISPIADGALFYYRYTLEDSYVDGGQTVHKIYCKPRRKTDPAFEGHIYIQEDTWRIHSLDLFVDSDAGLRFLDTVWLRQVYIPVNDTVWKPGSQSYYFKFNLFGIKGFGEFAASLSNYELNPADINKAYFKDRVLLTTDSNAVKKKEAFWDSVRAVPLAEIEKTDYVFKDSVRVADSLKTANMPKRDIDSLRRRGNRLTFNKLFLDGYKYSSKGYRNVISMNGLIQDIGYNAVEGVVIANKLSYNRLGKHFFEFDMRYGIDNERFYGVLSYENNRYRAKDKFKWKVLGGNSIFQVNESQPVAEMVNSVHTLLFRQHLARYFEKAFARFEVNTELNRDFPIKIEAEYARRSHLNINNRYGLLNEGQALTMSNEAYLNNREFSRQSFEASDALTIGAGFRYRPFVYRIEHPSFVSVAGSAWPTFFGGFKTAIGGVGLNSPSYTRVSGGLEYDYNFEQAGTTTLKAEAGVFLYANNLSFVDYRHFFGNRAYFLSARQDQFLAMPYYERSTQSNFLQAHLAHNFKGIILNKLPLIRKLKASEIIRMGYLNTQQGNYLEASFTLAEIFLVGNISYSTSLINEGRARVQNVCFFVSF